jgi:tetratricopeptide (TPR) repeat protein
MNVHIRTAKNEFLSIFMQSIKNVHFLVVLSCLVFCGIASAESTGQVVDWFKIEQQLYNDLKTQGGKSEAEIEETIGHALLMLDNQWERSIVHLKRAVELDPKRFMSWYDLGLIYMGSEDGDSYLRKSAEANPGFAPSFYWLGYSSCRVGHDKEAIVAFEKYLQVAHGAEEADRINVATSLLEELRLGKLGPETEKIRSLGKNEAVLAE